MYKYLSILLKSSKFASIAFGLFFLFNLFMLITNGVPYIYSDGFGSYHTTQCLITEQSWTCANKPQYYPDHSGHGVSYYKERYTTVYAPGSAIVNLPLQVVAHIIDGDKDTYNDHFSAAAGHSFNSGLGFLITAIAMSTSSVYFIYAGLRKLGYTSIYSVAATTTTYASSYAVWYVFLNSAFNHTTEIFGLSIFFYAVVHLIQNDTEKYKYSVMASLGTSLAVLARPPLIVVAIGIVVFCIWKKRFAQLLVYLITALPAALVYLSYNITSYGKPLASSYSILFNQDFEFDRWNIHNLLFSTYRGWFVYSPIFLFACIALIILAIKLYKKTDSKTSWLALITILPVILTAALYGFWPVWWGGGSYGQRFLISFTPFMAFGVAVLLEYVKDFQNDRLKKYLYGVLSAAVIWTLLLTLLYRFTPVAEIVPKSDRDADMLAGDRYTPFDIFAYHLNLAKSSNNPLTWGKSTFDSISGGASMMTNIIRINNNVFRIDDRNPNKIAINVMAQKGARKAFPTSAVLSIYENGELIEYTVSIKDALIMIDCNDSCVPKLFTDKSKKELPTTLSTDTHIGFTLEHRPTTHLYFEVEYGQFYKGNIINLPPGVPVYTLN